MAAERLRPQRPSAAPSRDAAAIARKLTAEDRARISIPVTKATHRAVKMAARRAGKASLKLYVLGLLQDAGVEIAAEDLEGEDE